MPSADRCCPPLDELRRETTLRALRSGMRLDDAEDCAGDLVARVLERDGRLERACTSGVSCETCINRRILHHVIDSRRSMARVARHLQQPSVLDRADESPGPEEALLRTELRGLLLAALDALPYAQLEALLRRCPEGPDTALAVASSRTPNALRCARRRARIRLRAALERRGLREAKLRAYLAPS
ncbi:MAG: hypothetical protein IT208_00735 [Chthonomonadales bacterium]|nr:hypothetical protein [Chthonomonadales bacterium]